MKSTLFAPAGLCIALLIAATGCGSSGTATSIGTTGTSGGGTTGTGGSSGPNSLLSGKYAFSLSGSAIATGAPLFMAGSFTADGAGNITGGIEDIIILATQVSNAVIGKGVSVSGTYSIGADGRGTLNFNIPGQTPATQSFKFAIENGNHGQLIRFDSGASGSGTFDLQTSSAFTLNSLTGNYAFDWNGSDGTGEPADGVGAFSLSTGMATGAGDLNDAGNYTQATVSATLQAPDANGHGTATIVYNTTPTTTLTYGYDIISANRFLLIETDGTLATVGEADLQSATFTASSLSGNYAISLSGANGSGNFGLAGQIETSGGNIASSDVTQNSNGAIAAGPFTLGTYTFANVVQNAMANGRFQITATEPSGFPDTFVAYLISPNQAFIMEADSDQLTSGQIVAQTGTSFSSASLNGNYGINVTGVDAQGVEGDFVGQFTSAGTSTLNAGTVDINDEDLTTPTLPNNAISAGSYSVINNSTGHGTLAFTAATAPFQFAFYFVSPNQIFLVETDDQVFLSVGSALSQPTIP